MRSIRFVVACVIGLSLLGGAANAAGISSGVPYELSVTVGGNTFVLDDLDTTYVHSATGGTYTLNGPAVTPLGTVSDWDSTFDYDPQVTNNFTVVNTTAFAQIFTVSVTSPIAAVSPSSLMRGSIGITLTDEGPLDAFDETDGSALLTSTLSTAVYRAYLDGSEVQALMPAAYSQSCGLNNCTVTNSASFGIPVRIPGPAASTSMGITVRFELSPGDSASVTSVFNIIAVPEPSSAAALGLGLFALAVSRRRRSA